MRTQNDSQVVIGFRVIGVQLDPAPCRRQSLVEASLPFADEGEVAVDFVIAGPLCQDAVVDRGRLLQPFALDQGVRQVHLQVEVFGVNVDGLSQDAFGFGPFALLAQGPRQMEPVGADAGLQLSAAAVPQFRLRESPLLLLQTAKIETGTIEIAPQADRLEKLAGRMVVFAERLIGDPQIIVNIRMVGRTWASCRKISIASANRRDCSEAVPQR